MRQRKSSHPDGSFNPPPVPESASPILQCDGFAMSVFAIFVFFVFQICR